MEAMKSLKDLTLLDRFLFAEVMEDRKSLEAVLEIILGREVLLNCLPQTEKEKRRSPLYRNIRLDVWGEEERSVFDLEVQKKNTRNLSRRSRFYQGLIDGKLLEPGEIDFDGMKDSYIIIIAPFDLFGEGRYRYTFRMRSDENPKTALEDGAVRIFLNTHGSNPEEVSPELVELLKFMEHTNDKPKEGYQSERIRDLDRRIGKIKSSEKIGVKYMQAWEERELEKREARQEGKREGVEIGKQEILRNQISKKLQKGKTVKEIAEELEETPEVVERLIKELK